MARYDNEGPRRDTPQERPNKERETSEHGGGMTSRQPGHGPACGTLVPRREWFPKYGPADGKRVTRYRHDGYGHEPEPERGRRKLTDGCGVGAVPRSPLPEGARSLTVFQPERIMYSHPGWTAPAPGIIRLQEALTAAGVRWWEDRKRDVTVAADLSADRAAELCGQHAVPSFIPVKVEFFAELTRLRLASLSMSLVRDDWTGGSSKTAALMELLDGISAVEGNQAVVFSQFTSYLAQIRAALGRKGIRYLYLDGQTDLDERRNTVTRFQDGDCPLLLASLKAGGLGLNLTAANYVILLDPWWNPAIENQAMDRAHRIGQKRTVTVIRLVARHTIEEKILRLHGSKQDLADRMLDGTAFSGRLTMDEVLEMVSPFR